MFIRISICLNTMCRLREQARSPPFANGFLPPLPVNMNCQVASVAGRCWRSCVRFYRVCRTHCAVRGVLSSAVSRLSNVVIIFQQPTCCLLYLFSFRQLVRPTDYELVTAVCSHQTSHSTWTFRHEPPANRFLFALRDNHENNIVTALRFF